MAFKKIPGGLNENHKTHMAMMDAFEMADKNTPRDQIGRASYGMGANGLPRTPAQQASVKKAAAASVAARTARGANPRNPAQMPGLGSAGKKGKGLLSL